MRDTGRVALSRREGGDVRRRLLLRTTKPKGAGCEISTLIMPGSLAAQQHNIRRASTVAGQIPCLTIGLGSQSILPPRECKTFSARCDFKRLVKGQQVDLG